MPPSAPPSRGMIPVAEIMIMDFIGIAIDQIVNLAAKAGSCPEAGRRVPSPFALRLSAGWDQALPTRSPSRRGSCTSPGSR